MEEDKVAGREPEAPGSAEVVVVNQAAPPPATLPAKAVETVKIRGNRQDNLIEASAAHRQAIAYRARWSDTLSDAVLWATASACYSRIVALLWQAEAVPKVYPLGMIAICLIPAVVALDTVKRSPSLGPAMFLRACYVVAGLLNLFF